MSEATSKPRNEPAFPPVIHLNGRGYIWRSALEGYKAEVIRHALGGLKEPQATSSPAGHDVLVPLKIAALELGVGRRTIGRRIRQAKLLEAIGSAS